MESRRLRLALAEPRRRHRVEDRPVRQDVGVPAADRLEEALAGDGRGSLGGRPACPGELGGVGVGSQADGV